MYLTHFFPKVRLGRREHGHDVPREVPRQVGAHEASERGERDARVVHVGRVEVLPDHVRGEHQHLRLGVEALHRRQVSYPLLGEPARAHDLDDVEPRPRDVVADHLQVGQLGDGVGLDGRVLLPQLGLDLLQARGDVLGLVLLVVADAADQVGEVLVEEPLADLLHLEERHDCRRAAAAAAEELGAWDAVQRPSGNDHATLGTPEGTPRTSQSHPSPTSCCTHSPLSF